MSNPTQAKVALVTGASKGIGRAIAQRIARDGVAVAVHYGADEGGARDTARAIEAAGGTARIFRGDVSKAADVKALFDAVLGAFGRLDIVVNNAGIGMKITPVAEVTDEFFDHIMATNTRSQFLMMREAAKRLADGGRIVNIGTTLTLTARPGFGPYAASKGAIEAMTRVLARELAPRNITVNAVSPGPVETELFRKGKTPEQIRWSEACSPMNRVGQPSEVAAVVAFLAGPEASWMTGQVVRANGGWL